jgi:galactokinase
MIGGGFGGSVLAMLPADPGAAEPIRDAVASAYAARDWTPPEFYNAVPSAGARRVH